jgi:hypothetical protein
MFAWRLGDEHLVLQRRGAGALGEQLPGQPGGLLDGVFGLGAVPPGREQGGGSGHR